MSMLYIRQPGLSKDGKELHIILTRGDSDQIGQASERFVRALLSTLGITFHPPLPQTSPLPLREGARGWGSVPRPTTWIVKPYRCNYYSEYWKEGGWESRWDFVWRLSLKFDAPVKAKPLENGYAGTDDIDDYSPAVGAHLHPPFQCLAIASFPTERQANTAAGLVAKSACHPEQSEGSASFRSQGSRRHESRSYANVQDDELHVPPFEKAGTGGICLSPSRPIEILQVGHEFHLHAHLGAGDEQFFTSGYPNSVIALLESNGGRVHAEN